jgi:hypothetical protein
MNTSFVRVLGFVAVCLAGLLQAVAQPSVAPTSGIIFRAMEKVWFDGNMTRTETSIGMQQIVSVTGDRGGWIALPDIGRVKTNAVQRPYWRPYPEHVQMLFSRTTNYVRLGEEEFLGLPCWRYEWVETNRSPHLPVGREGSTHKVRQLFLANPVFPLMMRTGAEGVWHTNSDVTQAELDVPIPDGMFDVPKGFKVTKSFQLPTRPFELLLRQTRSSREFDWTLITTILYSGDGDKITETRTEVHRDTQGEQTRGPIEQVLTPEQAGSFLYYPVGTAMWEWGKKVGVDEALGYDAEVFEATNPTRRYWIVDHPEFGSFSARFVVDGDPPETNEVVRVWVGE